MNVYNSDVEHPVKYLNKYRIQSARLKEYDYGQNGAYFITICTKEREGFFGEIVNGIMEVNEIGQLANKNWLDIIKSFPFVQLDEFIIMPNHIHGILMLNREINFEEDAINRVSTKEMDCKGGRTGKHNPMLKEDLSTIIRWYKGRTTFESRKINPLFMWQSRFYDHIIRTEEEYKKIQFYIRTNPANWENDSERHN